MKYVHRWLALLYLMVVQCCCVDFGINNPGLKIRFTKSGLNYGAQTAVNVLAGRVRGMTIPDFNGDSRVPVVGKISYTLSGISIQSFNSPSTTVTTQPFGWSIKAIGAKLHGNWKYRNHGFIKISDHGSVDVSLSGWAIAVTVTIGTDPQHKPTVHANSCNCYPSSIDVDFHGGASWLYNLFSKEIEKSLGGQLQKKLCDEVTKLINDNGESMLQKMKVKVPLDKKVELDYGLTQAPSFSVDRMESFHKGEVFWTGETQEAPFVPPPLPEVKSDKMVTFWLSQYVVNTLGYVDYKHDAIMYNLSKTDFPAADQGWLNTTCTALTCLGTFIPVLKKFCPDCSIEIHMAVSKAPSLQISADKGLDGSFEGILKFYLAKSPNNVTFAFSIKVSVSLGLSVAMKDMKIIGKVKQFSVENATLVSSNVGNVTSLKVFVKVVPSLLEKFVQPQLDKLMEQGIELPKLDGIQFVEPVIQLVQNAVVVLTNLKYTG